MGRQSPPFVAVNSLTFCSSHGRQNLERICTHIDAALLQDPHMLGPIEQHCDMQATGHQTFWLCAQCIEAYSQHVEVEQLELVELCAQCFEQQRSAICG